MQTVNNIYKFNKFSQLLWKNSNVCKGNGSDKVFIHLYNHYVT